MNLPKLLIAAVILILVVVTMAVFTVNERERAVKFRLGEIVRTDYEPGLHLQVPFINNVKKFDARIQTLDAKPQRYLTSEKKNVLVDSFVKWRIGDVGRFYTAVGGDVNRANQRLFQIVDKQLRDEFGKRTIQEVVSGERAEIMKILDVTTSKQAKDFGIDIVDVRVKRVDLPRDISDSVYNRMRAERSRVAKELRARGRAEAERIRAEADREYTIILAKAYREAEQTRGQGDAKSAEIYAQAFGQDQEFFSLVRSLNAYKKTFGNRDDVIILEPDSEFFKYFKNPETSR